MPCSPTSLAESLRSFSARSFFISPIFSAGFSSASSRSEPPTATLGTETRHGGATAALTAGWASTAVTVEASRSVADSLHSSGVFPTLDSSSGSISATARVPSRYCRLPLPDTQLPTPATPKRCREQLRSVTLPAPRRAHRAGIAPASAVAELGVVGDYTHNT